MTDKANNKSKTILDLCGGTGAWSKPYQDAGYNVKNITLPEYDILDEETLRLLCEMENVYGILFATDCTCWANSGARWFWQRITAEVWEGMKIFFKGYRIIMHHKYHLKFWAIENPVGKLRDFLGDPNLIFDPCDYGDPYTKKTCLWGKFNHPKKTPVMPIQGSKIHKYPPSDNRKELRSITPAGFAKAFFEANQ
jgi:hypothetical protein